MAQQTAVEWLINELTDDPSKFLFLCDKPEYMNELTKIIIQAKKMEKEQMEQCYKEGIEDTKKVLIDELKDLLVFPNPYKK